MKRVEPPRFPPAARILDAGFLITDSFVPHFECWGDDSIVSWSERRVRVWDLRTREERYRLVPSEQKISACAASSNGELLALGLRGPNEISLVAAEGVVSSSIPCPVTPSAVALSHDARLLAFVVGEGVAAKEAQVASLTRGSAGPALSFKGARGQLRALRFDPTSTRLAAISGRQALVWSVGAIGGGSSGGVTTPALLKSEEDIADIAFVDQNTLLLICERSVAAWDLTTSLVAWRFVPERALCGSALPTRRGVLIALGREIVFVDPRSGQVSERQPHAFSKWRGTLSSARAFALDSHRVRELDLETDELRGISGSNAPFSTLAVSPDGERALLHALSRLEVWDVATATRVLEIETGSPGISAATFVANDAFAFASHDELRIQALSGKVRGRSPHGHGNQVKILVASADGSQLIACSQPSKTTNGFVTLHDSGTGAELWRSPPLDRSPLAAVAIPGRFVVANEDGGALVIDSEKREISKQSKHRTGLGALTRYGALSPDGTVWVGGSKPGRMIDLATGRVVGELDTDEGLTPRAFLDPRVLVISGNERVEYWDVALKLRLAELAVAGHALGSALPTPSWVLIKDRDGALFWLPAPVLELAPLPQPEEPGPAVAPIDFLETPGELAWLRLCAWLNVQDRTDDLLRDVDQGLAHWPAQLRVAPVQWLDDVVSGRAQPRLRIVRSLQVENLHASGALRIVESSDFGALSELCVAGTALGDDAALELLSRFPNVERLVLRNVGIGPRTAKAIAAMSWPRLKVLELDDNSLSEPSVVALLRAKSLERLHTLGLSRNRIAGKKLALALGECQHLANLRFLDLSYCGKEEIECVLCATALTGLEALCVSREALSDHDAARLARAEHLRNVRSFELNGRALTAVGIAALAGATFIENLVSIDLGLWRDTPPFVALRTHPRLLDAHVTSHNLTIARWKLKRVDLNEAD